MSILLIDDDAELTALMAEYFAQQGIAVDIAADGRDGLAKALSSGYELVILDGMLPVLDGLEVLGQLRQRSAVPVIMLTARTAHADRIQGLETGADDYLPKPFHPGELLARVRAVLRRTDATLALPRKIVEVAGVRMDPTSREVWNNGMPVTLTSIEFEILGLLLRGAGRIVSRDEIAAALYQREASPYERGVDVHVSHLRKKLEWGGKQLIRTIRGTGYLFTAD